MDRTINVMLFPSSYEIWQMNARGQLLVAILAIAGALLGGAVAWRGSGEMRRRVPLTLFAIATIVHALTIWILRVDPHRDSGDVPLPFAFALLSAWTTMLLYFVAPVAGAYVVVRALLALPQWRRRPAYAAFALMAAYAIYIAPWATSIVAD